MISAIASLHPLSSTAETIQLSAYLERWSPRLI
jgi:hypothetical protein